MKSLNKKIILTLLLTSNRLHAETLSIPHTFSSGSSAKAIEVNENFSAIKEAVDENSQRITTLETKQAESIGDNPVDDFRFDPTLGTFYLVVHNALKLNYVTNIEQRSIQFGDMANGDGVTLLFTLPTAMQTGGARHTLTNGAYILPAGTYQLNLNDITTNESTANVVQLTIPIVGSGTVLTRLRFKFKKSEANLRISDIKKVSNGNFTIKIDPNATDWNALE